MSVQPFVLRPDQREPALNVVGTQVTALGPADEATALVTASNIVAADVIVATGAAGGTSFQSLGGVPALFCQTVGAEVRAVAQVT